jgi:hypothetical protein
MRRVFVLAASSGALDWATISSLATAAGTLVLAVATFAAVRSSNRAARVSEIALQEQRRPILVPSRLDDPVQKLNFADGHWIRAEGGYSVADRVDGNVHLGISLRNVGSGVGVCQAWAVRAGATLNSQVPNHMPDEEFRLQTRDLYIPGEGVGMWQGAIRNREDPLHAALIRAIDEGGPITIELLYSDLTGSQRAITRFGLQPFDRTQGTTQAQDAATEGWSSDRFTAMSRIWFLDFGGPRPDSEELHQRIEAIRSESGSLPI